MKPLAKTTPAPLPKPIFSKPLATRRLEEVRAKLDAIGHADAVNAILRRHGATLAEVLDDERGPAHVANARHEVAAFLRSLCWSYPAIGRFLNRDHTTIMNSVKKARERNPNAFPDRMLRTRAPLAFTFPDLVGPEAA